MPRYLTTLLFTLSLVITLGVFVPVTSAKTTDDAFVGPPAPSSATDLKDVPDISTTAPPPGVPMSEGVASVMSSIMTLFAWLLGVAVITLDNAVYYTVVKMGSVVNGLSAIGVAWRILRDITNIALIFGFLAIGISTILGSELYGWSKNMLPKLLMAAVFLNFSLFITEAVIDIGNLFATQFYMQINGGQPAGAKDISTYAVINDGIASKIMNQLGLQNIYGDATTNSFLFESGSTLVIGFMSIILFLVTSFVMFSLAFILIARFVTLILLIVVAPIGFAGYAVPKLEGLAKQWSSILIQQTITAPILLLALYVALAVITDAQFLTGFGATQTGAWNSWVEGGNLTNFAGVILSFIVAIALLLGVIIISRKLGAYGGDWATKTAGKLSFGATAWAGRTTLGRTGNKFATMARRSGLSNIPILGTGLTRGLDRIGSSSFDVRSTRALKQFPLGVIDAGDAQKGGYKAALKSRIDSRVKYASELKGKELTPEQKAGIAAEQSKIRKLKERRSDPTNDAVQIAGLDAQIEAAEGIIEGHESGTDKGAQRKYAKNLLLGLDKNGKFNKYFNFMANTEASKKIRLNAKETKDSKTLKALMRTAKRDSAETGGATATPHTPPGGGAPAGGAPHP